MDPERQIFFDEKIEPLLKLYCLECHSHAADEVSGGLALDSRSGWAKGGASGPAIIANNPDDSLLIKAVRREDADLRMPPDEKLPDEAIELLVKWVNLGAPDPRKATQILIDQVDPTDWWSLRPLKRPAVPKSGTENGEPSHAIDTFVQQKLEAEGLSPCAARRSPHFDSAFVF